MQETERCRFDPGARKIPWRRAWQPTPIFLPGESHGQWSLVGYSPKSKIMAAGPITSWQIGGKKIETVTDFIFMGSKITVDSD